MVEVRLDDIAHVMKEAGDHDNFYIWIGSRTDRR